MNTTITNIDHLTLVVTPAFKYQVKFEKLSKILTILAIFFIPISTSLLNITLIMLIISWFLSGTLKEKLTYSLKNPICKIALILFSWFIFGCFYAYGPFKDSIATLIKMTKLLCPLFFLPILREQRLRYYGSLAFVISMLLSLILGVGKQYLGLPLYLSHASSATVFKSYIDTNLMMALSVFILAHSLTLSLSNKIKYFIISIMVLMTLYVLWLSEGRSGYFVYIALWILFCIQKLSVRQSLIAMIALTSLLGIAGNYSSKFQNRLSELPSQIQQYRGGELNSVAQRIDYFRHTYALAKQHLILGWGTGSLKQAYGEFAQNNQLKTTSNPHNEYLNILFQLGVPGLFIFLLFLSAIFKTSLQLPDFEKRILQGILLSFMLGCFANSWLMDFTSGYLFVILTALCAASYKSLNKKESETQNFELQKQKA